MEKAGFDVIHGLSHPCILTSRRLNRLQICVARPQQTRWSLGQSLHPMPNIHGSAAHQSTLAVVPDAKSLFQPLPHGPCWPITRLRGFTYLLTVVDHFTSWPEAVPLGDETAYMCALALIMHWISRFGAPAHISSDKGHTINLSALVLYSAVAGYATPPHCSLSCTCSPMAWLSDYTTT